MIFFLFDSILEDCEVYGCFIFLISLSFRYMKYYDTVVLFLNSVPKTEKKIKRWPNISTGHLLAPWSLDQNVVVI